MVGRNRVVGIAGSYGGLNVGDEAILTVAISALRTALPGVEVVAFSRNVVHTREHHDVDRVVPAREAMRAQVKSEVQRLDVLLLGGGGILYDREAESYLRLARVAQQMGVPTATYAIGAGPLERSSERQAVVEVLNRMRFVTVRDLDAKLLLDQIGVERPIAVTADPALLLKALPFPGRWLEREGIGKKHHLVGMSVREPGGAAGELEPDVYHALLAHAADFIVDRFDADVLFVSMERQDIREAHRVIGQMAVPERAAVLRGQYPPGELLGLMRHVDFAVGMRLHFLIFAAVAGVPLLALPYAGKVSALIKMLDMPGIDGVHRTQTGPLLASIDRMWDLRTQVRAQLDERLPALQRRAAQTAPLIAELLDERKDPEDVIASWQALELGEHAPASGT
ncbi:MAG: polysaccharide pyruvyl transferase family protein [Solirubrobacteraceae bacterium]